MFNFCGVMGSDYLKLGITLTLLALQIQCDLAIVALQYTATPTGHVKKLSIIFSFNYFHF